MVAMMVSLERKLRGRQGQTEEEFCRSALQRLTIANGPLPKLEDWTVSPFDVDFNKRLGEGGL